MERLSGLNKMMWTSWFTIVNSKVGYQLTLIHTHIYIYDFSF